MSVADLKFPDGFLWGVSTSAHQVEGGLEHNNWAEWERQGHIRTGERAGDACDWWRNAERDFDLARDLSMNALRLSVEWSRIEPEEGRFDDRPLERYRQMLQALHARGIRPFVSLHHFTHPLWFERKGGFLAPDAVRLFERFTTQVADALGDLCQDWVTFNEPNVFSLVGYVVGEFPPGGHGRVDQAARVMRTMLRAHAAAYRVLHAKISGAQVGFTQNMQVFLPARAKSPLDRALAWVVRTGFNEAFLQGLHGEALPWTPWRRLGEAVGLYDFVGFNHYGWMNVGFDRQRREDAFVRLEAPRGMREGDPGLRATYGGIDPEGLGRIAERLARMGKPLYVLEHGVPDAQDRLRPWLITRAAVAMHEAISRGIDLRGYFHWTLVDNFEWAEGWRLRFGLFELDPRTQARTPRRSAEVFAEIARNNAVSSSLVESTRPADDATPR